MYVPHLWYYDLLLFVKDQELPRQSVSNIQDNHSEIENEEDLQLEETGDDVTESLESDPTSIQSSSISRPCSSREVRVNTAHSNGSTQSSSATNIENQKQNKRKSKFDEQKADEMSL
ncbi:hypothetical protein FQR65_LT13785 [Abscondita terminalis]|nr:hypothetical protein FQR65_LT13785 [Abscondita terminalis]